MSIVTDGILAALREVKLANAIEKPQKRKSLDQVK
jgi:hypothetical protein